MKRPYRFVVRGLGGWLAVGLASPVAFAATSIPFTVTMSEPVLVAGCPSNCPRLVLDVGGVSRYVEYASGTGTATLTFTYAAQPGDLDLDGIAISSTSIDLNTSGTVTDLNGNPAALTFTAPNTTGIKVDYPTLAMDFVAGDYLLNGTHHATLSGFLSAASGSYTRNSIGTYFDSSGVLQTASANTARFNYDPVTHAANGLLIEESRTNAFLRSSELDNSAAWTPQATSLAANVILAPDNTISAEEIIEDTSSTFHNVNLTTNLAAANTYTISIFARANTRHWLRIFAADSGPNNAYANFDLQTGVTEFVFGNGTYTNATIQNVGNGWYRCALSYALPTNTTRIQFLLRSTGGSGSSSYAGDGVSGLYLWGAQLEQGAFPTSYIPTTSGAGSRQADIMTLPTGTWYSQPKGTLYGYGTSVVMNVDHRLATIRQNYSDYYGLRITGSNLAQMVAYDAGGIKSITAGGTVAIGGVKMAATQQSGDLALAYSGGFLTSSAVWSPITASYLAIGYDGVTTVPR